MFWGLAAVGGAENPSMTTTIDRVDRSFRVTTAVLNAPLMPVDDRDYWSKLFVRAGDGAFIEVAHFTRFRCEPKELSIEFRRGDTGVTFRVEGIYGYNHVIHLSGRYLDEDDEEHEMLAKLRADVDSKIDKMAAAFDGMREELITVQRELLNMVADRGDV